MKTSTKLELYRRHMAERGVASGTAFPPLWQLLWSRGFCLPPPPFMGFFFLTAVAGSAFGVLFGAGAWLIRMSHGRIMPLEETFWVSFATGLLFGLIMAAYYRHMAYKHRLGSWAQFSASELRTQQFVQADAASRRGLTLVLERNGSIDRK